MPQLDGRVAIVTGGGNGIGRAIAFGFAAESAAVVVADVDGERAEAVAAEIGSDRALGLAVDVSDAAAVEGMAGTTVERFGSLDILVNNAGVSARGLVAEMTDEQWDRVIAVNLRGTFLSSRAAVRRMQPRGWGRIVNTASGLGIRGSPGGAVYGVSKAAIINFTRALAQEVASHGITVNAIGPGGTDTAFWRAGRSGEFPSCSAFFSSQWPTNPARLSSVTCPVILVANLLMVVLF